jgi:NAD(P)-dependent dehydrogenase (short-subunit alcohol dehydrogenase family)
VGLLDGKVAIISGVGPGLGRAVAFAFAGEGASVVIGARTEEKLVVLAREIEELGGRALAVRLDITDADSCRGVAEQTVETFGRIDVLVNNAFVDGDFQRFEHGNLDDWRRTMETNLFGTLQLTQTVVPVMKEQRDGRIVMVNSMSAVRTRERFGAYSASKAALASATRTLALELGRHGIRVNGVHPGYIWSDSVEQYFEAIAERRETTPEAVYQHVADETALGYLPDASEVAGAVVFFASDLAKPITGQALGVNAGHWFQG